MAPGTPPLFIRNAGIVNLASPNPCTTADVRCRDGRVVDVGTLAPAPGEEVLDVAGAALLPGLHDHHIHLFALAASRASVSCGPPDVTSRRALATTLAAAPGTDWIRGIDVHESVVGDVDRTVLDAMVPHRPVRLQHATGKLWLLNSAALRRLDVEALDDPRLERDAEGRLTGRLWRADELLGARLRADSAPDLGALSRALARYGVTGVTDATVTNDDAQVDEIARQQASGRLLQRVHLMGGLMLAPRRDHHLSTGEYKILLDEDRLPPLDALVSDINAAHSADRAVAFHAVTRIELLFALAALRAAERVSAADRLEHASEADAEILDLVADVGVAIVTQPAFIAVRGDRYSGAVGATRAGQLYPLLSVETRAIPLRASSDAPYGPPDPWLAMAAALDRRTDAGCVLGAAEALTPEQALAGWCRDTGGVLRQVTPGSPADLCLLKKAWPELRTAPRAGNVAGTWINGVRIYRADA